MKRAIQTMLPRRVATALKLKGIEPESTNKQYAKIDKEIIKSLLVDNQIEVSTYDSEYTSLAEFLTDRADAYNEEYGEENWSTIENPE